MAKFWAIEDAEEIIKKKAKKYIVSSMVTPSGPIHLGNLREVLTNWAICQSIKDLGESAELVFTADNFDPLRKVYPFLPKNYNEFVGCPLSEIPDPWGCHQSYSEHFLVPFFDVLKQLGVEAKVHYADKMYKEGVYTEAIKIALENTEKIKNIIKEIAGTKIDEKWSPFNPLCAQCHKLSTTTVINYDLSNNKVNYQCACGYEGVADFSKGEGKLVWRVHWPATWFILKSNAEAFGKDHATPGGSYDTCKIIAEEIFNWPVPYPIIYEWVYLKGQGVMASSTGVGVTGEELFTIMPPEMVKYYILRSQRTKHLEFDLGKGMINLFEEFADLEERYHQNKVDEIEKKIFEMSQTGKPKQILPKVPTRHLITIIQAAQNDEDEIFRLLERTGHQKALKNKQLLMVHVARLGNWLKKYAPEEFKFNVCESLPEAAKQLSSGQKKLLTKIADLLESRQLEPQELHNQIYQIGKDLGLSSRDTFKAIYLIFLGQDFGPKAGWFLSILDQDFVIKRLREAVL